MRQLFLTLLCALCLAATAQEAKQYMVVTLKDGTTARYDVAEIDSLDFGKEAAALVVAPAGEAPHAYAAIPTLLRQLPAETGQSTQFAFGTVETADAAGLCQGDYGVCLAVSAAKVNTGAIDLAADKASYTLRLAQYADGAVAKTWESPVAGTATTQLNKKTGRVTVLVEATFDDGTTLHAAYEGAATDVDALDGMFPEKTLGNEFFYYGMDGGLGLHTTITGCEIKEASKYQKLTKFTFTTEDYINGSLTVEIHPDLIGAGELSLPAVQPDASGAPRVNITYYTIQLSGPNSQWRPVADNGTVRVDKIDDEHYEIAFDAVNTYATNGTAGGTPERIRLHYKGAVE